MARIDSTSYLVKYNGFTWQAVRKAGEHIFTFYPIGFNTGSFTPKMGTAIFKKAVTCGEVEIVSVPHLD